MRGIEQVPHSAALDALVLMEERVLSFRAFSSLVKMSTRSAQEVLQNYAAARSDKVVASWLVTTKDNDGMRKLTLVQGKRPEVGDNVIHVDVWGVASSQSSQQLSSAAWVSADRLREIKCLEKIVADSNELRDNPWNPVKSKTAEWDAPGVVAYPSKKEPVAAAVKNSTKSEVTVVKTEKSAPTAPAKPKKRTSTKKGGIQFNRPKSADKAKAKVKTEPKSTNGSTTTKKARPAALSQTTTKKTRRIVESDDEESDEEEDAFEEERKAMESEERDAERAAEQRANCIVLDDEKTTMNESRSTTLSGSNGRSTQTVSELGDDGDLFDGKRRSSKRAWESPFGKKEDSQRKKYRLIEVEETVQLANGYIGTKRVKKYVDKDGNEKPADVVEVEEEKKEAAPATAKVKVESKDQHAASESKLNGAASSRANARPKKKSNGSGSIKNYFSKKR